MSPRLLSVLQLAPTTPPGPTDTPFPVPTDTPSPTTTPSQGVVDDWVDKFDGMSDCVRDGQSSFCDAVYDVTGSEWLAGLSDVFLAKPITIAFILLLAALTRFLVHRAISRMAERTAEGGGPDRLRRRGQLRDLTPLLSSERRRQRAQTIASVLRSISSVTIFSIAGIMVLDELSIPVGPILASAGIIGLAVGFGAQNLVKDFLSGMLMLMEDQYGVGDVVDLGEASGVVESVGLRTTRLRDVNGTVWYVRNGEVLRVGNMGQGWARAVVDLTVAYEEDLDHVRGLLKQVADDLWHDTEWSEHVVEEPEVWGVESLGADGIVVRVVIKTAPLQQWAVGREFRRRVKAQFDAQGVEIPFPQRTVRIVAEGAGAEEPREATRSSRPHYSPGATPHPEARDADETRADQEAPPGEGPSAPPEPRRDRPGTG